MLQRLRNLLPSGTQSGTRTPQEATPQPAAEGSHSQGDQHRGGTPDSIAAALSLWVLDFDVHVFLDRIITNDLIYDLIFDACSARTLVRLLCTCRATSLAVKEYMSRAFNINRLLSRYFSDPMAFRHLQACTGTVISGSTCAAIFRQILLP
ncbi:hypothetical protein QCA50_000751 [Cerrena zonata]|uniref:Uncharacterized protein n=1 Tax=Cerrena zonata TaxID=2478898 RepID=A0AAW0GYG4_9APHY